MPLSAPNNTVDFAPFAGRVSGVLFDIDETLVDLVAAMKDAMVFASSALLPGFTAAGWDDFSALYMADPQRYYDRYVAGEFTFHEQRGLRAQVVFGKLGVAFSAQAQAQWITDFEAAQPRSIRAFADVVPLLDALDAAGIPYGAVSNNVHAYQRAKLNQAGLARVAVLVGIDTVGVAKPDPAIFLEGCRQLGTVPGQTLYVGDNYLLDGVASIRAGLSGVWLNRESMPEPQAPGAESAELERIQVVVTLDEIGDLLGLSAAADSL
ncbi:HAD family hydrolase [Arthrobacter sp. N199823]|uniref:HAD family hydrolase n=1 Tax=Arthrobacter sp. N199823 TaxID=2058895 RepID=UPI000CE5600C|nr:HAD family hydrolase [Arthrobacter sp. N199823]